MIWIHKIALQLFSIYIACSFDSLSCILKKISNFDCEKLLQKIIINSNAETDSICLLPCTNNKLYFCIKKNRFYLQQKFMQDVKILTY